MGGCINVPDEYFTYGTEHVAVVKCCQHVAHAVVYSSGVRGALTFLTSTYVTERVAVVNMLHMPSYIHQGGWEGVLTFLTTCNKDYPHKRFKMAQVNHMFFFTKTYHFRGRSRGKSHRTIVAGIQHMDGTWKHVKKWKPMSMLHKKNQQVYKKGYSWAYSWTWRHNVALLESVVAVLLLKHSGTEASRRGKQWMGGCLHGMIENHNFQSCFNP